MRSVLSRPLEILPSLFHSAVSPQLPSTGFKHWEGWEGKETLLSDFGIQCLWLAARVKALIPWRFRKPTGNRTKFPNSYQDRHSLAGFPGTSSSFTETMTSRCPCSLNADVSKVISLLRKLPYLYCKNAKARRADKWWCKTHPLPGQLQHRLAGYCCKNSVTKIKGSLPAFKYFIKQAEAHTNTLYWEFPDVLPHLNKAFQPRMSFPAFEGSAQKAAGKHTLAAFVYRLRQTQWSFTQWKRPPGYGEPGLKSSICSEL